MKKLSVFALLVTLLCVFVNAQSFSDVSVNSWYSDYVEIVSDNGIMGGVGDNKFSPDGNFTVAQCLAIGARLHSDGKQMPETDGAWYQPYVNYCVENDIIENNEFDSYSRNITREETARILAKCCAGKLSTLNSFKGIADMPSDDEDFAAVLSLYNAGIVTGSNDEGAFLPKTNIKRSEVAAICSRIVDESLRIKKELPYYGSPRYLVSDTIMHGPASSIMSGWRYDNKYSTGNKNGTESNSVNADIGQKAALYRPINKVDKGWFRADVLVNFVLVENGAYISLDNSDNESVLGVRVNNGKFEIHSSDFTKVTDSAVNSDISAHAVTFDVNFEKDTAYVIIDDKTYFDIPFYGENIARISTGLDGSGRGAVSVEHARAVADYSVNENFLATEKNEGKKLYGNWKTKGDVTFSHMPSERGLDVYSAKMKGTSLAQISFDKTGGKVCFEMNVLLPDKTSPVTLGTDAFSIYTKDGVFYRDGTKLRNVAENVWTNVRFEMDFTDGTSFVRINGKDCGVHKLNDKSSFVSKAFIELYNEKTVWLDDVMVFSLYEYDDYPTPPKSVNDDGYEIGVNVCNLWRNGNCGEGYDAVAPFDELYPYVGLADEGLPELADWEIKQMAEHGIDFQHICWYSPQSATNVPVKGTQLPQIALNDGYMKSKYSEYVKFCIMWENGNVSVNDEKQFKDFIWPYFKEYYLSDPRYYSVENKAVITIWNYKNFISSFGGNNGAKQILDFMRQDVKTLGYDGLVVLFSGNSSLEGVLSSIGADGVYAYNYGRTGEYADYQISIMKENKTAEDIYYVPAVSVGFNAVGRHDERSGMITPDEHRRVCEYIRDEYIPSENDGSWHDNFLIVSTWNEYTEGTYVAPSNLYGFDYIDNIRNVFTDAEKEHEDIMPSEKSRDRMRNIYPDGYSPIRRYRLEDGMEKFDVLRTSAVETWDFSDEKTKSLFRQGHGLSAFGFNDTAVYGSSKGNDFSFVSVQGAVNVDLDETGARYLHVRMKSDCISHGEMFFTTDETTNYIAQASGKWDVVKTGEFVDYYVDMSSNNLWNGVLTGIRIDPMANAGNFEVELVELLSEGAKDDLRILFDGVLMKFDFLPEYNKSLDDYMVTLNPRLGFFSMSHTYHEYNVDEKSLYIESLYGNVLLENGNGKAIVNGREAETGFVFSYRDGLPVVPIKWLMKVLGFECKQNFRELNFKTLDKSIADAVQSRKEGEWEFDRMGDCEGFTFQNNAGYVYDGSFNVKVTGYDNAVKNMNLDIDLSPYSKVVVRIRYKTDAGIANPQIYFQTKSMPEMTEKASVKIFSQTNDTKGEFFEFTFDLSQHDDWKGVLTGIRFDPFHGMGEYSIDYIRLAE